MIILTLLPLSSHVVLAKTPGGWRLSDGHRFTLPYRDADEAMEDRETFRRLTFGEDLAGRAELSALALGASS